MLVTINQLRQLARDDNGEIMPVARGHVASESRTAAGSFAACLADAAVARVATDTAITINAFSDSASFMPAGSVEYFPAREGKVFTIAVVA